MRKVIQLDTLFAGDTLAEKIAMEYSRWKTATQNWETQCKELRRYIFATDTTTTTNSQLPWKNKTTLPKICQIRDNLHANYMSALFPHEDWFTWIGDTEDDNAKSVADAVTAYLKAKLREGTFYDTVSKLVYDWIDYGNCFAQVVYDHEVHTTEEGETNVRMSGPRLERISPFNHKFDITAATYQDSPKITKHIYQVGTLKKFIESRPSTEGWSEEAFSKAMDLRKYVASYGREEVDISDGITVDGFGSLYDYYCGNTCEILEFEGDIYDLDSGKLYSNHIITVLDRRWVLRLAPLDSWLGVSNKHHAAWRYRPDNLMGMGPLDNLVGMQYRIDHLENLKADVFDQIANPLFVHYGDVEDWEFGPGARIYADQDSRVDVLRPDSTALNADFQIAGMMNLMEEMAGAPKQAMGIRTPGEKTAFEVAELQNAASRIFQNKITQFEEMFLEPILNQMLEVARRHIETSGPEVIRILNDEFGVEEFRKVDPSMIKVRGKLVPKGARHFARKAQLMQNIHAFINSAGYADPGVQRHISGLAVAKVYEELMDVEKFELVRPNIRISEETDAMELMQAAQRQMQQNPNPLEEEAAMQEQGILVPEELEEEGMDDLS